MRDDLEQSFRDLRAYAFAIAYRMLGSVSEAEDVVQDVFLRFGKAVDDEIRSPKTYIATVTTRLAIDTLRSARVRRESYVGPWLPEPLLDEPGHDAVFAAAETADSLSMAVLVVLETLNPVERAVFLLHDVFGFDYDEVAAIVNRSEVACRQLASRARRRVHDEKPRFEASREQRDRLAARFFAACQGQDVDALVDLLAGDAVLYGDGGTKGSGVNRPIYGRDSVSRMLATWFRQMDHLGIRAVAVQINGQPGAKFLDPQDGLVNVISLDIADGAVQTVRSIINPDKLAHLGRLSPIGRRSGAGDRSRTPTGQVMTADYAANRDTTEGHIYDVSGDLAEVPADARAGRLVVNFGPQHPSSHGVLRLVLELDGETVTDCRPVIGYLHTGIEKNTEYRTWTQGVTLLTRADYLSCFFNETVYCHVRS